MNNKITKKIMAFLLISVLMAGFIPQTGLFADVILLQPPKQNRIKEIGYIQNINNYAWYANLAWDWDPATFPPDAEEKYITIGLNEVSRGTGNVISDALTIPLSGSATEFEFTEYNPEGINHGTIYEAFLKSSYKVNTASGQYNIISQKSNPAKFLTGLHVSLELVPGTNNIRIKWDDVWDTSGRINYQILISDTKGFTQPPPVPDIIASEIGKAGSAVTINVAEKKLEYIYTNAMPGREYSIKVVPLPNAAVSRAPAEEIEPITIKTDILLKAQKVGFNNDGDTIWKLFWNPIVKGSTFTRVDYELYRYVNNEPQGQIFRLIPEIDNYQITVKKGDLNTYSFKIDAQAYVQGSTAPIDFRSNNKVQLKEQIPQQPQAPELMDSFPEADPPVNYEDLLTAFNASIFWKAPKTGEGTVDSDIVYDIYLVENIEYVSNPPTNFRIASDLMMNESNEIRDAETNTVIGYRYNLEGLKSNSTYYFIIYAKKSYLVESPESGFMITMPFVSKQAVKVIITKPDAGSDRPVAPSAPPFAIKKDNEGMNMVTFTGATLELDKKWYAFYSTAEKRWEQVSYEDYIENDLLDPGDPGYDEKRKGMIINYLPGWSVVPHVVNYNAALNVIRLRNNRAGEYITYSDLSQADIKAFEIPQQKIPVPNLADDADQTFSFNISGLSDNDTYLVWVTIENQNGTSSDPSDSLIVSTPVDVPEKPVTPTVPEGLRGIASDSFVDLFWTYIKDMNYEIKGGKSDKLEEATITKQVTYAEIKNSTFSRIDSLEADTLYYFWIKAISRSEGGLTIQSEFSNPLVIKTEAHKPPAPPSGFGIKNGPDGVTERSVTYLWTKQTGLSYILEFADNLEFNDSEMIVVDADTYTKGGLISNRRYYARLYAYNPATKLRSESTRTIMIITNKSKTEYDSSYDLDEAVTGDGLDIPVKLVNGIWTISSKGANGHVLGERIRNQSDSIVKIDLSKAPAKTTTIRIELSSIVMDALSDLKKELYVIMPWGQYTIRPGTFQTDEYFKMKTRNNSLDFRLETVSPASAYKPAGTMQIKTAVTDMRFSYIQGAAQINKINIPIRVELPVSGITNYAQGKINTYSYNGSKGWYRLPTFTDYSLGQVVGELDKPGAIVAATEGIAPQSAVPQYIQDSMERLQSIYDLKSIKNKPFNHNAVVTQKDALKLIFDVIPVLYNDYDIADKAFSAGLVGSINDVNDSGIRRDKAINILISYYKLRTKQKAAPTMPGLWSHYADLSKADSRYLNDYKFALEMGIIRGNAVSLSYPERLITMGEFLVFLERTLTLCGDL